MHRKMDQNISTRTSSLPSLHTSTNGNHTFTHHNHFTHYKYTDVEDYVTMVFLTLASVWIVFGNTLVITAFIREKGLRTTTNYYILSLCMADFIIGIFVVNFYTVFIAEKGWHLGGGCCVIWLIVDYGVYQASVFGVVVITVDRFLLIKYPFIKQLRIRTSNRVKVVIVLAWLSSFLLWVPAIVHYMSQVGTITTTKNECHLPFKEDQGDKGVIVATAVLSYIVPVILIVYVALHTYCLLWKSKKLKERVLKGDGQKKHRGSSASRSSDESRQREALVAQESPKSEARYEKRSSSHNSLSSSRTRKSTVIDKCPSPAMWSLADPEDRRLSSISFQQISRQISVARSSRLSSAASDKISSPNLSVKKRVIEIQKISRFVILMAVAFTLTILPFGVLSILRMYSTVEDRHWRVACILAYLNSALNPLCYAFGNRNFNEALRNLFRRKSAHKQSFSSYKRRSVFV